MLSHRSGMTLNHCRVTKTPDPRGLRIIFALCSGRRLADKARTFHGGTSCWTDLRQFIADVVSPRATQLTTPVIGWRPRRVDHVSRSMAEPSEIEKRKLHSLIETLGSIPAAPTS
jgi:hypothetical protein